MSNYNTQLQSNNTDLQRVLQVLQTKATGVVLPELTNEGVASDLLSGKQLIDSDGNVVEGTIPTKTASTYIPTISNQTIAAGTYCSGIQTIKGDANLVAENIKSGVNIFGVSGNYKGNGNNDISSIWFHGAPPESIYYFNSERELCTISGDCHNHVLGGIIIFTSEYNTYTFEGDYTEYNEGLGFYVICMNNGGSIYYDDGVIQPPF